MFHDKDSLRESISIEKGTVKNGICKDAQLEPDSIYELLYVFCVNVASDGGYPPKIETRIVKRISLKNEMPKSNLTPIVISVVVTIIIIVFVVVVSTLVIRQSKEQIRVSPLRGNGLFLHQE